MNALPHIGTPVLMLFTFAASTIAGAEHGANSATVNAERGADAPITRARFTGLRFSPDGRYVLAVEPSGFSLLGTDRFALLFQAKRPIIGANFSTDSREVVVITGPPNSTSPHILYAGRSSRERWVIAEQALNAAKDIEFHPCQSTAVSPDFHVVACVDSTGSLRVTDIVSGETLFEKKRFGQNLRVENPEPGSENEWAGTAGIAQLQFSSDARFLLAVAVDGKPLAYDVTARKVMRIAGHLKRLRGADFTFIASNRIVSTKSWSNRKGVVRGSVVDFPSGKVARRVKVPPGHLIPATNSEFVVICPFGTLSSAGNLRSAAVEISTGLAIISDTPALDVFGPRYVAEFRNSDIGLYEIGKGLVASVHVPSF